MQTTDKQKSFYIFSLKRFFLLSGILITVCAVYAHVLDMDYVSWDDNVLIQENPLPTLALSEALPKAFSEFYHGDYFPLTQLSYWADFHIAGWNPAFQHGENLLIHILNILLLALVLRRLGSSIEVCDALSSGTKDYFWGLLLLLFALHPMQVESVAWISERKGLAASALILSALFFAQNPSEQRSPWKSWIYGTLFGLSLLFKSNGILLPFFLLTTDFLDKTTSVNKNKSYYFQILRFHFPALVLALVGTGIRTLAYQTSLQNLSSVMLLSEHWLQLPIKILTGLGFYVSQWLWPNHLSIIYPPFHVLSKNSQWITAGSLYLIFIGLIYWGGFRKSLRPWRDLWCFFAVGSLTFLLPVMQIIPRLNFVNDRYIYLSGIGITGTLLLPLILHIQVLLNRWFAKDLAQSLVENITLASLFVFGGSAAIRSSQEIYKWGNSRKLWETTVQQAPWSGLAQNNWGILLREDNRIPEAIRAFEACIQNGWEDGTALLGLNSLGIILSDKKNPEVFSLEKAIALFQKGIQLGGASEQTFHLRFNLALVFFENKKIDEGLEILRELKRLLESSQNQRFELLRNKVQKLEDSFAGSQN